MYLAYSCIALCAGYIRAVMLDRLRELRAQLPRHADRRWRPQWPSEVILQNRRCYVTEDRSSIKESRELPPREGGIIIGAVVIGPLLPTERWRHGGRCDAPPEPRPYGRCRSKAMHQHERGSKKFRDKSDNGECTTISDSSNVPREASRRRTTSWSRGRLDIVLAQRDRSAIPGDHFHVKELYA